MKTTDQFTHHSKLLRVLLAIGVASLVGCASYQPPVAMPEANISTPKLEDARKALETLKRLNRDAETVAAASVDVCLLKGRRLPFIPLVNPQYKDKELRAAYLVAGLQEQPQFVSTGPSTQSADGKYIAKVGSEIIKPGDSQTAFIKAVSAVNGKRGAPDIEFEFTDKSKITIKPYSGCAGIVYVGLGTYEPLDVGFGLETLSITWFKSTHTRDEQLFLAGRALYFASDAGAEKIRNGLLGGSALNGILKGATFGLSQLFVDGHDVVTRMMRNDVSKQADEFGLRAAVRAGADPKVVLAYVERMSFEKEKVTPFKELWFEDGRVKALAATVNGLAAKNSTESKGQSVVGASL